MAGYYAGSWQKLLTPGVTTAYPTSPYCRCWRSMLILFAMRRAVRRLELNTLYLLVDADRAGVTLNVQIWQEPQTFNLINALQPVYRNNGGGCLSSTERSNMRPQISFSRLWFFPDARTGYGEICPSKICTPVAQFDDGDVRYGVHVELAEVLIIIPSEFSKMIKQAVLIFFVFCFQ